MQKYDIIIHKLTEDIDREDTAERVKAIGEYLDLNSHVQIVDPFENVRNVTSRARTINILQELENSIPNCIFSQPKCFIFNFLDPDNLAEQSAVMLLQMERLGMKFPVICKPIEACGTPESHFMVLNCENNNSFSL